MPEVTIFIDTCSMY